MLGNFSIGQYFKQGAAEYAWDLSLNGFGFNGDDIWITVHEGDDALGLGADEEAIAVWEAIGVPRSRIILLPSEENFWQAGPTGPCGPCSELYLDRGLEWGTPDDLPGGDNERFLEYWNLVFMQYDQDPIGTLTPLPAKNIDTGLGLNRMAMIQQGVDSIFETDQFLPLMTLGRDLATSEPDERALRILADHTRGMTFLIADGVVPSNEDRGYVLRRIMRRALLQGHRIGIEHGFLPQYVSLVVDLMGAGYPELLTRHETIDKWVRAEEESFGRTLEQGTRLLDDLLAAGAVSGADAFRLHDTYGFPIELTREIAAERGVPFAGDADFERLMGEQRARSRQTGARVMAGALTVEGEPTTFTGYEHLEEHTTVTGLSRQDGRTIVKLAESPFYAEGGGQISDGGVIACEDGDCLVRVADVVRAGDDQAIVVEPVEGELKAGERVVARVDRAARTATQANHTATHLLHAALRAAPGPARPPGRLLRGARQAALRLLPHPAPERGGAPRRRGPGQRVDPAQRPGAAADHDARRGPAPGRDGAVRREVRRRGADGRGRRRQLLARAVRRHPRALHGGDRAVQDHQRGLERVQRAPHRGGHRPRGGPAAAPPRRPAAPGGRRAAHPARAPARGGRRPAGARHAPPPRPAPRPRDRTRAELAARAAQVDGAVVLAEVVEAPDAKALMDIADRVKGKLGDSVAIVLGTAVDGRVHLVAAVTPALVQRGVRAGEVVKVAAQVTGGGGGGRDTMAQAGGRDPDKLPEAIEAARAAIVHALG